MTLTEIQKEYRRTAIRSASEIGLVVLLYDALLQDLYGASRQIHLVEQRTAQLNHALAVLQILEGNLDFESGGSLAQSLSKFYSVIRAKILTAQLNQSAEILEQQASLVSEVRDAWQTVDLAEKPRVEP